MQAKKFSRQHHFDFVVKKKGNGVIIEGFSNANTVDRMKERIDPNGWDLTNYEKNAVILFDHGHDPAFGFMPIGKALVTEKRDDGLYTKVQLSNSQTEKITAIRDLVSEGILKTFSVGFDPKEDTKDGDTLLITKAELIEQSIVPIPMNQDSVFGLLSKRLKKTVCPGAKRWFENWMGKIELVRKGAFTAALLHQRIADMEEMGNFDRAAALEHVAKLSGVNMRQVKDILAGEVTPVPEKVLVAFAEVLRLNPSFLKDMDKSDVALIERARTIASDEGKGMASGKNKGDKAEAKKAAEFGVHQVIVPKEIFDEQEVAAKFVEDNGYAAGSISETTDSWVFEQSPGNGLNLEKSQSFDLGDGVTAIVAPIKAASSEDEKNVDAEDDKMEHGDEDEEEGDEDSKEADVEAAKQAYEAFKKERETAVSGGEGNPPAWVADEAAWQKAKQMAEAAEADDKYAFTVYAYLQVLGGGKKAGDVDSTKAAMDTTPPPDENPILELQKQQVGMLGVVIEELKKVNQSLAKEVESVSNDSEDTTEDGEDDMKAMVLRIQEAHSHVKTGLKRLGV